MPPFDGTTAFAHEALPGRVVFEAGARRQTAAELDRIGASRVLIIAAERRRTEWDQIFDAIGERAVGRCVGVVQHVPRSCAEQAREQFVVCGADAVLAIGGGSAIGLGKAVALAHPAKLVAIPTTYAGSEMTPIWGMTDGDRKETGRDLRVLPDLVIYDPELTRDLPAAVTGPSGMNALAHCVEATYGPGASPITTLLALEGMRALAQALPKIVATPTDLPSRSLALYGAYLAGSALAVGGTALHHKTCHVLGGMFGLGHGEMNAVLLPYALRFNKPAIPKAYERMSNALEAEDAADALRRLAKTIGSPESLSAIGMPREGIAQALPRIIEVASANVRPPDVAAIRQMLEDAYRGTWT